MGVRVQPTISDFASRQFNAIAQKRGTKATEEIALVLEWYCRSSEFRAQLENGFILKSESEVNIKPNSQ